MENKKLHFDDGNEICKDDSYYEMVIESYFKLNGMKGGELKNEIQR